ncbi:hypothetical protein [Nocardia cyriacigeorgica]|uniref:hypothetical protein n=1 Tax=Nocardia cyriacigeorgica TaxID=135487 RepID=UPI003EE296C2
MSQITEAANGSANRHNVGRLATSDELIDKPMRQLSCPRRDRSYPARGTSVRSTSASGYAEAGRLPESLRRQHLGREARYVPLIRSFPGKPGVGQHLAHQP